MSDFDEILQFSLDYERAVQASISMDKKAQFHTIPDNEDAQFELARALSLRCSVEIFQSGNDSVPSPHSPVPADEDAQIELAMALSLHSQAPAYQGKSGYPCVATPISNTGSYTSPDGTKWTNACFYLSLWQGMCLNGWRDFVDFSFKDLLNEIDPTGGLSQGGDIWFELHDREGDLPVDTSNVFKQAYSSKGMAVHTWASNNRVYIRAKNAIMTGPNEAFSERRFYGVAGSSNGENFVDILSYGNHFELNTRQTHRGDINSEQIALWRDLHQC